MDLAEDAPLLCSSEAPPQLTASTVPSLPYQVVRQTSCPASVLACYDSDMD